MTNPVVSPRRALYEDVQLRIDARGGRFQIIAPWVEIEGLADLTMLGGAKQAVCAGLSGGEFVDASATDSLLESLRDYAISYPIPRTKLRSSPSHRQSRFAEICPSPATLADYALRTENHPRLLIVPSMQCWNWDITSISARSCNESGQIDPMTFQALLARRRLKYEVTSGRKRAFLEELNGMPKEIFLETAGRVLEQAHYVTRNADDILASAASNFPEARDLIERLRREERGHDRFISGAIVALSGDACKGEVLQSVRLDMALFALAASHSLLAFACMLSAFEGIPSDDDPLALILEQRGYAEAASGLRAHWRANKLHGHEGIAEELCSRASVPDGDEADFCGRLIELSAFLQDCVDEASGVYAC